jgi:hypothetical protein
MKTLKTRQIDSLSKVQRLLAWAGISLAAVLVLSLAEALSGDTFGRYSGIGFWFIMTASGYWGSAYRNHRTPR